MTRVVLVALLGAAGALTRYGLGSAIGERDLPVSTFLINVVGSFALGVLVTYGATRWSSDVTVGLGVGFLGAFTTFSTFTVESALLGDDGRLGAATLYVLASVAVGILAAAAGIGAGRALVDA